MLHKNLRKLIYIGIHAANALKERVSMLSPNSHICEKIDWIQYIVVVHIILPPINMIRAGKSKVANAKEWLVL